MFEIGSTVEDVNGDVYTLKSLLKSEGKTKTFTLEGPKEKMVLELSPAYCNNGWYTFGIKEWSKLSLLQRVMRLEVGDMYQGIEIGEKAATTRAGESYKYGKGELSIWENTDGHVTFYIDNESGPMPEMHPDYQGLVVKVDEAVRPLKRKIDEIEKKSRDEVKVVEGEIDELRKKMVHEYDDAIIRQKLTV
jgi:hypothetical protein